MNFLEKQSLVALMHFLWLGAYEKALNFFLCRELLANSIRRALFDHANIVFLNENANSTRISSVSCIISIPSDYYLLFRICSREKKVKRYIFKHHYEIGRTLTDKLFTTPSFILLTSSYVRTRSYIAIIAPKLTDCIIKLSCIP